MEAILGDGERGRAAGVAEARSGGLLSELKGEGSPRLALPRAKDLFWEAVRSEASIGGEV